MINPMGPGSRRRGTLLVADITGFTGFLQGVSDAHPALIVEADEPPPAYAVLSHLLDTLVSALVPPFELVKFEGDAIFVVAPDDGGAVDGATLVERLRACNAVFSERLEAARSNWTCTCSGCVRIGDLGVKFVLHHGDYVAQRIAGREELLGTDVNVVHRLLKNHARDLVGLHAYGLLSDALIGALGVPTDGMIAATEVYGDLPPVAVHVVALD